MFAKELLKKLLPSEWRQQAREWFAAMNIVHVYGPRSIQCSNEEAVVTCVVKNGAFYIESFIKHYSEMGFRHIFFLDNGSSDQTLSIARSYDNVSICQSALPISSHQRLFKKYLAERLVRTGWCLDADIDEFFDYPLSDIVGLQAFLAYLNLYEYTAATTQLLDMFSDRPISHLTNEQNEDVKSAYQYYDLSDIAKTDYCTSPIVTKYGYANKLADRQTPLYWGGIRKMLYGNNCLLTKHSLFLLGGDIKLFPHVHFVNNASVADISGVMLHYKLTSNAMAIALQNRNNFTENYRTYDAFIDVLERESTREIRRDTAQEFVSATNLTKCKFLLMSAAYEEYAMARKMAKQSERISTYGRRSQWPASRA